MPPFSAARRGAQYLDGRTVRYGNPGPIRSCDDLAVNRDRDATRFNAQEFEQRGDRNIRRVATDAVDRNQKRDRTNSIVSLEASGAMVTP